ncbi:hypothetical protein XP1712_15705 [Xanthomonas perforans]|nr:hypothetical protein XP1712_15705 [Xanthomonas perforans]RXE27920.1 hypothetical protein DB827_11950 [Xanthomonas perforans]
MRITTNRQGDTRLDDDDSTQDQLMAFGEMHGWRLEVWKSGFWLDTYDYRIRPVPAPGDPDDEEPTLYGCAFRSVEAAKEAALTDFRKRVQLGHFKLT